MFQQYKTSGSNKISSGVALILQMNSSVFHNAAQYRETPVIEEAQARDEL